MRSPGHADCSLAPWRTATRRRHLPAAPDRLLRQITVFMRNDDGSWRRDDERHHNVLIDTARGPELLAGEGVEVSVTSAFGAGRLLTGLGVLIGRPAHRPPRPDCRSAHAALAVSSGQGMRHWAAVPGLTERKRSIIRLTCSGTSSWRK